MKHEQALQLIDENMKRLEESLINGQKSLIERYFRAMAQLSHYSYRNVIMILSQLPEATDVAGYASWKKRGRQVRLGETGIAILAPIIRKKSEVDDKSPSHEANVDDDSELKGFRIVYVFDVSQTNGEDTSHDQQTGIDMATRLEHLKLLVDEMQIKLSIVPMPLRNQGYSMGGEIRIASRLDTAKAFSVLVHELAHEMMHQSSTKAQRIDRTTEETEAEAVAFIVSCAFGIDTLQQSSDYITLYQGDIQLLQRSLNRIQRTSAEIILKLKHYESISIDLLAATANS